jgi:CheY-like chemotaxis protein
MSMQKKPEEMAIVVVAADPANTKTVSSYLKTIGYAGVKHMDNGIEAMQSLVENPCDLIIVDANVRFLPGWMLVKELKISEKVRNMPVILCGGGEPPASKEELQRYGVLDFFKMPGTASSFHFMLQSTVATASPSSGYHKAADSITIMITFDEAVTLAIGSAEATLNSGGTATYVSGSGTAALAFTYEILATENSGDLDLSATNALTLTGGGTLRDLAGNNATLTVPIGVTSGSLASNANLLVDTTAPSAFSVSSPVDTVTINDNTPTISWSDPTDADFYSLKVDMDAGCASPDQQHLAQAWATSKTLTTLADGTYYLCITAADSAGNNTNAVMTSFTVNTGTWSAITTTGAPRCHCHLRYRQ